MKDAIKKLVTSTFSEHIVSRLHDVKLKYYKFKSLLISNNYINNDKILYCCISYNIHGAYCVPLSFENRPAVRTILRGEVYEKETIDYICTNHDGQDIIHAGAFFGDFIPALSRCCSEGSCVWAFEPHPESYRCAYITILLNDIENVVIRNAGVGAEPGSRSLTIAEPDGTPLGGGSTLVPSGDLERADEVEVDIVKIDDVVPTHRTVSVIHLDVEGFEKWALLGSLETIERNRPVLILETEPSEDWLSRNLVPLGYERVDELGRNAVLAVTQV